MGWLEQLLRRFRQPTPNLLGPKEAQTLTDTPGLSDAVSNQWQLMQNTIHPHIKDHMIGPMLKGMPSNPIERQIIEHIFNSVPRPLLQRMLQNTIDQELNNYQTGRALWGHNYTLDWLQQRGLDQHQFRTTPELADHYKTMGRVM